MKCFVRLTTESHLCRYTSPDEKPFLPRAELPAPVLPGQKVPDRMKFLAEIDVNYGKQVWKIGVAVGCGVLQCVAVCCCVL